MSVKIYMGTGVDVYEDLHGDRGRCLWRSTCGKG